MHLLHLGLDSDELFSHTLLYFDLFVSLGTICSALRGDLWW